MDDKPRTYADAVEKQADFEGLVREEDSFEKAIRDEQRGRTQGRARRARW